MRYCILGMGKSGVAAARFLLHQGHAVVGVDRSPFFFREDCPIVSEANISLASFDRLVLSPGIALNHPLCLEAKKKNIPILGEAELGCRSLQNRTVGITGTNGKTTVASLLEHIFCLQKIRAKAIGNIGIPITEYCLHADPKEILFIEMSSYQIEMMHTKPFEIGLLLNISPDHLDRYITYDAYKYAKYQFVSCIQKAGKLFTNQHILHDKELPQRKDIDYIDYEILDIAIASMLKTTKVVSQIGYENVLAAWSICCEYGISIEAFLQSLYSFKKPRHRCEKVLTWEGITFYDDSKATTPESVLFALKQFASPVILIMGGEEKGFCYKSLLDMMQTKAKNILLMGPSGEKMYNAWKHKQGIAFAPSLKMAVKEAMQIAKKGDTILLSPSTSSYDAFVSYEERGEKFKQYILEEIRDRGNNES